LPKHAFLFLTVILTGLVVLTNPVFLAPLLPQTEEIVATATPTATLTPTATATPDPFAGVPTATPFGQRSRVAHALPTLPPVATRAAPTPLAEQPPQPPTATRIAATVVLPDTSATVRALPVAPAPPPPPTPVSPPPTRLVIPHLALDAPVEPVGMIPSSVASGVFEWDTPDHRAAGWLNTTAPLGVPGNTVLDGHNNINGEVFRDLWTLQPGDEITLFAGETARRYTVQEVLILPERDQPLAVRLRNARYILPTADERLTLVTCYPYESNTHRVVIVALPQSPINNEQ